jgi:RNA polymerase sigma factor (sigma-70 family)
LPDFAVGGCYTEATMTDDAVLLHRYAREKSQAAFAELVERRIDLVYGVALRKVGGDAHLAEDVAQRVFADVARKAAVLASHPAFAGWLFRSTHYTATQLVRAERRRRAREEKAETMKEPWHDEDAAQAIDWERLRPLLDDFISELGERDRTAVVGRFFEGLPLAEIGRRLQISEAGAQSRVERAVEKLRSALARRGVTSTSAALGVALANQTGAAAPAGLATSVTTAALAGAAGATTGSALLIFMSATKTAFTGSVALSLAGVLLLTSVGLTLHQAKAGQVIEIAWAAARDRQQAEDAERVRLERAAGEARARRAG